MTTAELELLLTDAKRRAEQARGEDLCGKYARCAFCAHGENACAEAFLLFREAAASSDPVPAGTLPEPVGFDILPQIVRAEEESPAEEASPVAEEPQAEESQAEEIRPRAVRRGQRGEGLKIASLVRKSR